MSDLKNIINLNYLTEKLMLANTPMYLFKNYQRDQSILELSQKLDTHTLIVHFTENINKSQKNIQDLALIYSIIVALTFKKPKEVDSFFNNLKKVEIRWTDKLSDIYFAKMKATTNYSFTTFYKSSLLKKKLTNVANQDKVINIDL